MADYKESEIAGRKWRRCNAIHISNPIAPSLPNINFQEQDVIEIDGKIVQVRADTTSSTFNPENMIDIIDPDTLEPTGETVPEGYIYLVLFSKYIAAAKARDEYTANMTSPTPLV